MKLAHLSKDAGQVVNQDKSVKVLSDYIKQVQKQETPPEPKTFDDWINEPWLRVADTDPWVSRNDWWTESEIDAARQAWNEAKK